MKSKHAKATDQLYLSRKELNDGGEAPKLNLIVIGIQKAFACACKAAFGGRWFTRLSNSAARAKKSPIGYAVDVLLR